MSLRDLVDPECGGANQLVRLGNQITRDPTFKDEGFSGAHQSALPGRPVFNSEQLINDFMAQVTNVAPPQTFRMDTLLKEMRDIDAQSFGHPVVSAPPVIQEVHRSDTWSKDFLDHQKHIFEPDKGASGGGPAIWTPRMPPGMMADNLLPPVQNPAANVTWTKDFFDSAEKVEREKAMDVQPEDQEDLKRAADDLLRAMGNDSDPFQYSEFVDFMKNVSENPSVLNMSDEQGQKITEDLLHPDDPQAEASATDWAKDYAEKMKEEADKKDEYNQQFWNRLQDEWRKIAEENDEHHPWLTEFQDFYDPYKEYKFDEDNPMTNDENVLEKGKAFLAQGDSSSAALCFESAAKQDSANAECWELLGRAQAENEKDPHAIAALKRALELKPDNMNVLMALAVSYTNEGLQTQALRVLINWMKMHPKYAHLVPRNLAELEEGAVGGSIAKPPYLADVQNLFLAAVRMDPSVIDTDIQEALGVLFNLSADYDKAVDCFEAVVKMSPDNPKAWNRLGASLANGNRSVEAVDAYQRALAIHPGFIRARYNVGIICINLKAYKEAAEHLLTALNHQATSSARSGIVRDVSYKQMSNSIWSTLRMAVSLLGRHDLQPAIDRKDLDAMNAAFEMNDV
ncbi:peroxisomal targeting signal 1 receptor [Phlebotomus argentipes]|uniref:peroxisomal targeting signal 1 receptor n=1 Tax=Phlebotomus argentipes TaxID=94469 RepID=UPI002892E22A|nr:peroxisomal targeting signal 1 receptor [Phlebotomus argentipes]